MCVFFPVVFHGVWSEVCFALHCRYEVGWVAILLFRARGWLSLSQFFSDVAFATAGEEATFREGIAVMCGWSDQKNIDQGVGFVGFRCYGKGG